MKSLHTSIDMAIGGMCCAAALWVTGYMTPDALSTLAATDAQLLLKFHGAAHEDIFGFGFWRTWAVLACIELLLLGVSWLLLKRKLFRAFVMLALAGFAAATVLNAIAYNRLAQLPSASVGG